MIVIRRENDRLLLPVRVTPKGSVNAVMPWKEGDDRVQVKVSVPPEGGKANRAVIEVLAKTLDLPKRDVTLVSGETSRLKTVALACDDWESLLQRLAGVMKASSPDTAFRVDSPG